LTKRIIAISNHADMLGGGEHSFLDLLSRLERLKDILAVVPHEGELRNRLQQAGIETQVAPLSPIKPWRLLSILSSLIAYFNLCLRYGPDLIYANGSRSAFYGGIVGRILNLPVVWHCRIADPDIYLDFLLRRLSTTIIANSYATAKRFPDSYHSKLRVVHNGVDLARFRDDSVSMPSLIDDTWKTILVVARVSRWKRHDLALVAFEQLAIKDQNVHLVCVGAQDSLETEWWDYLQNRSRQSKFSNRIHWIGQMEDVRPWYRAADILLLCSENEPFGRVLVEAMACGVPVIATSTGGVPEIVRHGEDGFLVTPGSVDEIADAIAEILGNGTLREQLAQSAIKRAESFDLDSHTEKMTKIFEETAKREGHAKNP
jgi:glycosyltransferase involved in cell wall biosynthesis